MWENVMWLSFWKRDSRYECMGKAPSALHLSGWRWWKVAHDKIQKCVLLECALGPLSHHLLCFTDGLFFFTVVGPCDSQIEDIWKNAVFIQEKCDALGKAKLTRECLPVEKTPDSSRESNTGVERAWHSCLLSLGCDRMLSGTHLP